MISRVSIAIPPKAFALLESLRSFGYSVIDSVADIVDNSIVARASEVKIFFLWEGSQSRIIICDNGSGMNKEQLIFAMSLGGKGPSERRADNDLGRFGLGMKTASLSQGTCLKVYSASKSGEFIGLCWDLKRVEETDLWEAIELTREELTAIFDPPFESGTIVIIEDLDRLIKKNTKIDDNEDRKHFLGIAGEVACHLGVIFHRYIDTGQLSIMLNHNKIKSLDPLHLSDDEVKFLQKNEFLRGEEVRSKVNAVLLNERMLTEENDLIGDYSLLNGIIVYRNDRIVSYGKWFNTGRSHNNDHKYFRVSIDFKSKDDSAWNIDVKKTKVVIPREIYKRLKLLVKAGQSRSREIVWNNTFVQRGTRGDVIPFWVYASRHGQELFIVNRDHPLVKKISETTQLRKDVELLLRMIEITSAASGSDFGRIEKSGYESKENEFSQYMRELGLSADEIDDLYMSLRKNR